MKINFFLILTFIFLLIYSCKKDEISKNNTTSKSVVDTISNSKGGNTIGNMPIDSLPYAFVSVDYESYKDTLQKRLNKYILLDLPITDTMFFYIPYKQGNGKIYKSKTFSDLTLHSVMKNNLRITLLSGKLNKGSGYFKLGITGGRYSSDGHNNSYNVGVSTFSIDFRLYDIMSSGFYTQQSELPINSYLNLKLQPHGYSVGKIGKSITDIDGNTYNTVHIGKQRWFQSILKVSKYNDGTKIQTTSSFGDTIPLYGVGYWNNFQYNWYVVDKTSNGNKNVCPTGWHVPSYNDWITLIDYLGDRVAYKLETTDTILNITANFKKPGDLGPIGHLWTTTSYNEYNGVICGASSNYLLSTKSNKGALSKSKGSYIRCVED